MNSRLEDLIVYLNELTKLDRDAITDLCNARVKVNNNGLLEHPTVQCGMHDGEYRVGLIGILNGFIGVRQDQKGYLCANYDLVCPNGHSEVEDEHCLICGSELVLGKIIDFGVTPG